MPQQCSAAYGTFARSYTIGLSVTLQTSGANQPASKEGALDGGIMQPLPYSRSLRKWLVRCIRYGESFDAPLNHVGSFGAADAPADMYSLIWLRLAEQSCTTLVQYLSLAGILPDRLSALPAADSFLLTMTSRDNFVLVLWCSRIAAPTYCII